MTDPTALAQAAFESIADDEALRGDLTDDGFGPLIDWASQALMRAAEGAATLPRADSADRMDAAGQSVKQIVAAAVRAAQSGDCSDLLALLQDVPHAGVRLPPSARAAAAATPLGDDADENARKLAGVLSG